MTTLEGRIYFQLSGTKRTRIFRDDDGNCTAQIHRYRQVSDGWTGKRWEWVCTALHTFHAPDYVPATV